jgi:hypothetical protein
VIYCIKHLFFPCLTFNLKRNRVKENREKGVHGEKKNAGVRTQKKGGTFRKKPCPLLLQVKWSVPNYNFEIVDTTEG